MLKNSKTSLMGGKKSSLELWRIVFTIGVAIMHAGHPNGFYIAVDFFFMLSGYLTFKGIDANSEQSGWSIFVHKISRLWPQYFVAFLMMLTWNVYVRQDTVVNIAYLADHLYELFFLQILFPAGNLINGITWYISATVICLPLVIYMLKHHRHLYESLIAPFCALFLYGYLLSNWAHVDFGFAWLGGVNGGLLRGLGGLSAGVFLYYISNRSKSLIEGINPNLLATMEFLIGATIIGWSVFVRQTKMDGIEVILLGVLIILSFHEYGWFERVAKHPIVAYLGRISYSIYLNQLFVCGIVWRLPVFTDNDCLKTCLYVAVLILFSMLTDQVVSLLISRTKLCTRLQICVGIILAFWIVAFLNNKIYINDNTNMPLSSITTESSDLHCSIDFCNGLSVLADGVYAVTDTDIELVLEGWAGKISTLEAADSISVFCNNAEIQATMGVERKDVAEAMSSESLLNSGWRVELPIEEVKQDEDSTLELVVHKGDEFKTFYFNIE